MKQWYGLAFALLVVSCAPEAEANKSNIEQVEADDPGMNAAKKMGRDSLPEFYRHLDNPAADESSFAVKFDLAPDKTTEYIWAGNLIRKNGTLSGTLFDIPIDTQFKEGQRVTIDEKLIIDWGFAKAGVMQGNVTTRVLIDRMPPAEAAEYKAQLGW